MVCACSMDKSSIKFWLLFDLKRYIVSCSDCTKSKKNLISNSMATRSGRNFLVGWMEPLRHRRGEGGHPACAHGEDPLRGAQ